MNKPHTPKAPDLREIPEEDDVDLSNLGPDDAPELTPEMMKNARTIFEIPEMAEFAEFIREGGRVALPEEYRKAVSDFSRQKIQDELWTSFSQNIFYVQSDLDKLEGYNHL